MTQAAIDARKPRAGPLVEPAEAIAMALPADINHKPTAIAHLGRGWL